MATYQELLSLFNETALKNKITVAVIVAAEAIRTEDPATTNHANRLTWAKAAFENPTSQASKMLMALLAANKDATVSAITSVTDANLQAQVDAAVDVFAGE